MRHRFVLNTAIVLPILLITATNLFAQQNPAATGTKQAQPKTAKSLKLNGMFADHMVLQQQVDAPVWGFAAPGDSVTVKPSWAKKASTAKADENGKWRTTIKTPKAGGPFQIQIKSGKQTKVLKDVLAGEVWICSGQSNMQWKLGGFGPDFFKADVDKANHNNIRFCQVPQQIALAPQDDLDAKWSACTPKTALKFSAVAYFFGDKLREELDVPIGLISTNWGGSSAEAWTHPETLKKQFPEFNDFSNRYPEFIKDTGMVYDRNTKINPRPKGLNHRSPAVLYNKMIEPLIPFSVRGTIWYQGESNVTQAIQYRKLFPAMIESWRQQWRQNELPFYFVQIAPFQYKQNPYSAAFLREAQTYALKMPNTGMVVTMDIGNTTNIHPKQKKPVGERLALQALAKTYGKTDLVCDGPSYVSSKVQGNKMRLTLADLGGGLATQDDQPLSTFTIAGNDKVFHEATAEIDGDTIVVSSPEVKKPVAVRFAWGSADHPNLINKEGLPASSFRTDDWAPVIKSPKRKTKPKPAKKKAALAPSPAGNIPAQKVSARKVRPVPDKDLPNIVFMMVDELAYFELSHMGHPKLKTPNIDQMAKEGIRFTNALAAAPVCGPLRCCLMTGLHTGHASMRINSGGLPIRANETTLADTLRERGYATGGFGKWGIGGRGSTGVPEKHGFDTFFGYYDQVHAHTYYPHHLIRNSKEVKLKGNKGGREGETYAHYEIVNEGLEFIRENRDRPFFCYFPWTPPHGMFDIPSDDPAFDLYRDQPWTKDPNVSQDIKNYAAMVSMIDRNVKQVDDLLKELGLDEKTIVIFSGDNGGENRFSSKEHPHGYFGPNVNPETGVVFRGKKRMLYEGGLRIPFVARWPGKIKAGQVSDHLFYQVDLLPTFADLTGASLNKEIDGISILPSLIGEQAAGSAQQNHEFLYWEYKSQTAVRKGNWKALRPGPKKAWELYDLATDISESNDVAADNSSVVEELSALAAGAHVPAVPGTFFRNDLQKRDREARNGLPVTPITEPAQPEPAAVN